ncbi:hypothetical protein L596_012667 [Steinernema carpocapsae]|uniref:Uncharacterized protein n=1 Tax=Steinernema carpocapsae TaxID=34508 RepID=A0A4U5NYN8_STECR|nr:hypothetical protein L596_012667 [Steinernema carpocapsae]
MVPLLLIFPVLFCVPLNAFELDDTPMVFGEEQQMDLCRDRWWRENYKFCEDIIKQLPRWYQQTEEYLLNWVFNYNRKHPLIPISPERAAEITALRHKDKKGLL